MKTTTLHFTKLFQIQIKIYVVVKGKNYVRKQNASK